MSKQYIVLGAGIAGFAAASQIRRLDPEGSITMITAEKELPYIRPLLSKTWFRTFRACASRLASPEWYAEQRIEVRTGCRVDRLDPEAKQVILASGEALAYDRCVYALGATCFVPPFAGREKKGVMTVRTTEDFDRIRSGLAFARRAVVIGGGVIGLEIAWELAQMDVEVTILEAVPRIMGRLLDEQSAQILTKQIENCGIPCHTGVQITEITGEEKADGVKLADGRCFPADLVIVSCGVRADIAVAKQSGLACDRGVLVDDALATSAPDVYAAGDCIQWKGPNPGLWNYARRSGEIAGANAASGERLVFAPEAEPVILSAMKTSLFSVGDVSEDGREVTVVEEKTAGPAVGTYRIHRHEGDTYRYRKLFYREGRLCGAVLLGDLSEMEEIKDNLKTKSGRWYRRGE